MAGYLIVNPHSGHGYATRELVREAQTRGVGVHVLQDGEDVLELARRAEADALGVAGGDGSLAPVAEVALERGLPIEFTIEPRALRVLLPRGPRS
jgi:diacylglycerol kinase family enzyme